MKLLKTTIYLALSLFLFVGCNNDDDSKTENSSLEVGDFHEGGVIFYLDATGEHGLISSITDQSNDAMWNGNTSENIAGADGIIIETGHQNTIDIENGYSAGNISGIDPLTQVAAFLCTQYSINGFEDWYLPSKDELNLISLNKDVINTTAIENGGTEFHHTDYWSSTEFDPTDAWRQFINTGEQYAYSKSQYFCSVRAIRAF